MQKKKEKQTNKQNKNNKTLDGAVTEKVKQTTYWSTKIFDKNGILYYLGIERLWQFRAHDYAHCIYS